MTYIKVGQTYKYLYRAADKSGQIIEFMRERETRRFRSKAIHKADDALIICYRSPFLSIRTRLIQKHSVLHKANVLYRRTANSGA